MNGLFNPCTRNRQRLCLLAGGGLPEPARGPLEKHLAQCAECRKYFAEVESVTTSLAKWEEDFAHVQPRPSACDDWARAVQAAGRRAGSGRAQFVRPPSLALAIGEWWHDVIWSCRRIWAGLAMVWVVVLAGHLTLRDPAQTLAWKSSPPSQAMLAALKERQTILAELLTDHATPGDMEPRQFFPTKPRTERVRILTT